MSATTSASRPRALGARYRLERLLGRGAMGEVWLGEETASGRQVAAKLLRPEHLEDPGLVDRFVRERSILLGLRDPGIVSVTDLVVDGEDLAIVMDYLDGGSLRGVLRDRGALAPALAAGLALRVLEALAYAHPCATDDLPPTPTPRGWSTGTSSRTTCSWPPAGSAVRPATYA